MGRKSYSLDETINVTSSILDHLNNSYIYRNDISSGTLSTLYSGLTISMGFPSDLTQVSLPTIAIQGPRPAVTDVLSFGELNEKSFGYRAFIFAGGERTNSALDEGKNLFQRARLLNDLKALLDANTNENIINYYNYSDIVSSGTKYRTNEDLIIYNVSGYDMEPTGPTEADRYRAVVDFDASLIFSQD